MNQREKIQRLIDDRDEARKWSKHLLFWYWRLKCRLALSMNTTHYYKGIAEKERRAYLELKAENVELRSGLVYYAVENAKLAGTMRDADDAHGEVPGSLAEQAEEPRPDRFARCYRCGGPIPIYSGDSYAHTCGGA